MTPRIESDRDSDRIVTLAYILPKSNRDSQDRIGSDHESLNLNGSGLPESDRDSQNRIVTPRIESDRDSDRIVTPRIESDRDSDRIVTPRIGSGLPESDRDSQNRIGP